MDNEAKITELSADAKQLIGLLIELSGFKPDYMEGQAAFQQRWSIWRDCEEKPERVWDELREIIETKTHEQAN